MIKALTRGSMIIMLIAVAAMVVLANGKPDKPKDRVCAGGEKPRSITAEAKFTGGPAIIFGFIGPTDFRDDNATVTPWRARGQACPGETAAITVRGELLTSQTCNILNGGTAITGPSLERTSVAGLAACSTVIT